MTHTPTQFFDDIIYWRVAIVDQIITVYLLYRIFFYIWWSHVLNQLSIIEADPEEQQNYRRRSLTKHYDVILIECFVHHPLSCILLPFWICLCIIFQMKRRFLYNCFRVTLCIHVYSTTTERDPSLSPRRFCVFVVAKNIQNLFVNMNVETVKVSPDL